MEFSLSARRPREYPSPQPIAQVTAWGYTQRSPLHARVAHGLHRRNHDGTDRNPAPAAPRAATVVSTLARAIRAGLIAAEPRGINRLGCRAPCPACANAERDDVAHGQIRSAEGDDDGIYRSPRPAGAVGLPRANSRAVSGESHNGRSTPLMGLEVPGDIPSSKRGPAPPDPKYPGLMEGGDQLGRAALGRRGQA